MNSFAALPISWIKIGILALICFLINATEFVIVGIIDTVAHTAGVSVATAGQLITVYSIASAVGVPIVMVWASKLSRTLLTNCAIVATAVSSLLIGLSSEFWVWLIARVFLAIGAGVVAVVSYAAAPAIVGSSARMRAMAIITMGFNAALVLALPLGRVFAQWFSWQILFTAVGVISFLLIFPASFALKVVTTAPSVHFKEQWKIIKTPALCAVMSLNFVWTGGYALVSSYITPLLQSGHLAETWISPVLGLFGAATLIGNALGGYLGDHKGALGVLRSSFIAQAGTYCVMTLAVFFLSPRWSMWILPLVVIAWGVVVWIPSALVRVCYIDAAPNVPDIAMSVNSTIIQIAFTLGAGIGGAILAGAGIGWLPVATLVLCFGGWAFSGWTISTQPRD